MKTQNSIETKYSSWSSRAIGHKYSRFWLVLIPLFGILFTSASAHAATLISQGYLTSGTIPVDSIVSLQKNTTDNVNVATVAGVGNILGVVINSNSSQVSVSSDQTNQVQVATSGVEPVLVSDINGNISLGDPITASPINGVGMKATSNTKVVGFAQDSFPNSTASLQTYTSKGGQKNQAKIGTVPVLVNVTYFYVQPNKTLVPTALQNIADSLAGKPVKSLPILLSIGIFIVTLIIVVSIIYAMIHSSIISVGRNPLSQSAVFRNVIQLSALVIGIISVAIFSIYMILTKL